MKKNTLFYKTLFLITFFIGSQTFGVGPGKVGIDNEALDKIANHILYQLAKTDKQTCFTSSNRLGVYLEYLRLNDPYSFDGVVMLLRGFYQTSQMAERWTHFDHSSLLGAQYVEEKSILDHLRNRLSYKDEPRIEVIEPQNPAEIIILFLEEQLAFIKNFRDIVQKRIFSNELNIDALINEIFNTVYPKFQNCVGFDVVDQHQKTWNGEVLNLEREVKAFIRQVLMDFVFEIMRENPRMVLREINAICIANPQWNNWKMLSDEELQPLCALIINSTITKTRLNDFINDILNTHYQDTPMTDVVIHDAVLTIIDALNGQGRSFDATTIRPYIMAWINNRGLDMEVVNNEQTEAITPPVITHPNINHCGSRSVVIVAAGLLANALSSYYFGSF